MSGDRVLIISEHTAKGYSGGRFHSWIMAEAIAAGGRDVTVWTNCRPYLMRDFIDFPAHDRIKLFVDPGFKHFPPGTFDIAILVPSLGLDWSVFRGASSYILHHNIPLIFLDFESPNWYNSYNKNKRSFLRVFPWSIAARYSDIILSTTRIGSTMARQFYNPIAGDQAFQSCYCAINSLAADQARASSANQIVCITRLDRTTPHKGAGDLMDLMCEELRGYKIVIIGSIPDIIADQLRNAASAFGISLVYRTRLTDLEKFCEIKSSRLMVFISHFEGFGLPPLEALYCGTPCLVRSLPVLRETGGQHLHYLESDEHLSTAAMRVLRETQETDRTEARIHAAKLVSFESYIDRIKIIIESAATRRARSRPRRFGLHMFSIVAGANGTIVGLLRQLRRRRIDDRI